MASLQLRFEKLRELHVSNQVSAAEYDVAHRTLLAQANGISSDDNRIVTFLLRGWLAVLALAVAGAMLWFIITRPDPEPILPPAPAPMPNLVNVE